MSALPDFTKVPFAPTSVEAPAAESAVGRTEWVTPEGIVVPPRYGAADVGGLDALDTYPGLPPFVRGPYATMYVNQPWTIRQYAGFSTAEESNAFFRRNMAGGQKGLSIAFDPSRRTAVTIPTTRVSPVMSGLPASPSTRFWTCARCLPASRSATSPCR